MSFRPLLPSAWGWSPTTPIAPLSFPSLLLSPSAGWGGACPHSAPPLLLPDGLAPSEPRSVRADGIPGSERHAAHRRALAGRGGARRVDRGRGARRPPVGRAAELRDQPLAPAQATRPHIALLPSIPRPSRPCADAWRGLVPSGTRRAVSCPRRAPGSPLRAVTAPLSPRVARAPLRTPVTVCPPAPRLRPPIPLPLPTGWARRPPSSLFSLSSSSLLLPDGVAPSEPRSVRADGIPGSERHAAHRRALAGRGGARRVDRGRGARRPPVGRAAELRDQPLAPAQATRPHIALLPSIPRPSRPCADAWRGLVPSGTRRAVSCPRRAPGSPPRAVTARYRLASPTPRSEPRLPSARPLRGSALPAPDPPLPLHRVDSPLAVLSLLLPDGLSPSSPLRFLPASDPSPPPHRVGSPPAVLSLFPLLLLSPSAGWGGALGAAERAGRCYPRFGAERHPPARVSGAGGARRVDRGRGECPPFGRAAEPARSAARASSGHPLAPAAWGWSPTTPRSTLSPSFQGLTKINCSFF